MSPGIDNAFIGLVVHGAQIKNALEFGVLFKVGQFQVYLLEELLVLHHVYFALVSGLRPIRLVATTLHVGAESPLPDGPDQTS